MLPKLVCESVNPSPSFYTEEDFWNMKDFWFGPAKHWRQFAHVRTSILICQLCSRLRDENTSLVGLVELLAENLWNGKDEFEVPLDEHLRFCDSCVKIIKRDFCELLHHQIYWHNMTSTMMTWSKLYSETSSTPNLQASSNGRLFTWWCEHISWRNAGAAHVECCWARVDGMCAAQE